MQILRIYKNMLRYINTDYKGLRCIKDKNFILLSYSMLLFILRLQKFKYLTQIIKILIC